jgi:hypothetical protein
VMNVKMVIITQVKVEVLQDNVILHLSTMSFDLVTTMHENTCNSTS